MFPAPRRNVVTAALWFGLLPSAMAGGAEVLARLRGADFKGGANAKFGSTFHGRDDVNYVYAQATGASSSMRAAFALQSVPREPIFLYLEAMDDDPPETCKVRVALNGRALLEGPSGFVSGAWQVRRILVPPDALKAGENEVVVANCEAKGPPAATNFPAS